MLRLRLSLLVLFLSLCATLQAQQERDYAGRIWPGRMADYKDCTVSPSGALWLCWTQHDDLYHTDSISNRWRVVPDSVVYDNSGHYNNFFVIVCPDSDKVLVFGKIHNPKKKQKIEKYYLFSPDGGKNWEYRTFAGRKQSIRAACHTRSGRVWIASDTLYYSENAGESFSNVRPLPSIRDIFMHEDNQHGIACQYKNGIFISDDNWQHVTSIPTPQDQGLIRNVSYYSYSNYLLWCYQVLMTDAYYLVKQEDDWFITRRDTICWQPIPIKKVSSILANPNNGKAMILSEKNVIQTSDFQTYDTICLAHIRAPKNLIGIENDHLYGTFGVPSDSIFCLDLKNGTIKIGAFFSDDIPISEPSDFNMVRTGDPDNVSDSSGLWGHDENSVLRYDSDKKFWYRVLSTDFYIRNMIPYRDEAHPSTQQVVISDGRQHFLVSDENPQLQPFHYNHPLDAFLKHPMNKLCIKTIAFGCLDSFLDEVVFVRHKDRLEAVFYKQKRSRGYTESDTIMSYEYSFSAKTLDSLLFDLNMHYDTGMTQSMFQFTNEDYEVISSNPKEYPLAVTYLQTLKDSIPNLSDSLMTYILTTGFWNDCTGGNIYEITLINNVEDTLFISMRHNCCSPGVYPYIVPYTIRTGDIEFFSTHVPFMQFIGDVMPPKMLGGYLFRNEEVLYKIMRYLTTRSSQDRNQYFRCW